MFGGSSATPQSSPTVLPVAVSSTNDSEPAVYCTGYCVLGKNSMVFLSDGRTACSANGDVQMIRTEKVQVFGSWFLVWSTAQIVKQHPEMVYHSLQVFDVAPVQIQESYSVPASSPSVIVNSNRDYRDNLHNIKPSGFTQGVGQSSVARASLLQ
jgi:hypothetical protein